MNCETVTNIDIKIAPNDTWVDSGLVAPVSGNYKVDIEFNGTYQQLTIVCIINKNILIPNIFNGQYNHLVQIFKPDASLLNNTCYCFKVRTITNFDYLNPAGNSKSCTIVAVIKDRPDASVLFTLCNGSTIPGQYPSGNTLVIPHLIGLQVAPWIILNNGVRQDIPFDNTTGTFNNTANGGFNDGDLITISYDEPIA